MRNLFLGKTGWRAGFYFLAGVCLLDGAASVRGQTATNLPPDRRDEVIRELLLRMEALEGEVRTLKSGAAGNAPETAVAPEETGRRPRFPDLKFHGFGDV